jgi:hypothetical protein
MVCGNLMNLGEKPGKSYKLYAWKMVYTFKFGDFQQMRSDYSI